MMLRVIDHQPRTVFAACIAALALTLPAAADEFSDSLQELCSHAKECALAEMEGAEGMSDSVKAMVLQSLDSMCVGLEQSYGVAIRFHELHDPAVACMNSMTAQECSVMMDGGDQETPECIAYQQAAEKYESD